MSFNSLDFEPWCAASQWSTNSLPSNQTSSPKSQKKKKRQLKDRANNEVRSKNIASF
jgi:hypothetical protein